MNSAAHTRTDAGHPSIGLPAAEEHAAPRAAVRNPPLAQVFVCKGCCCGDTSRQRPPVPLDQLKTMWKTQKLNRSVQLCVSGCVGPCSFANVVMLMSPDQVVWLGPLTGDADYQAIIDWAQTCHTERRVTPIPELLRDRVFRRFDPE